MTRIVFLLLGLIWSASSWAQCTLAPNITVTARTSTSITISTSSTAALHQLEYGPLGFTPGSGTLTPWFSGFTRVITGLTGSTGYDVYIRDSCTNNNTRSPWSNFNGFATTCTNPNGSAAPASIPWFENFDQIYFTPRTSANGVGGYMCGWIPTPNNGYAWVSSPVFQNIATTGPNSDHSGRTKYLFADRFGPATGGGTPAIIRTPQINLAGATSPVVSFWYHMYGQQIDSLVVEASQVGNPNWVRLGAIPANPTMFSSQSSPWQQLVYPLTMFTGSTVTIRFVAKANAPNPFFARIAIDDIWVGQGTGCLAPSNFTVSGIQATSAVAGVVMGSSTHHQVSLGPVGSPAGSGSLRRFSGTSGALTGLTPNTTYDAWIRDSCGPTSFSNWVGPVQFTTACTAIPAPWSETFDGPSWTVPPFNQAGTWPNCWNRSFNGLSYVVGPPQFNTNNTGPSEDHTPGAGGKYVFTESIGTTNGTLGSFSTPWIDLTPLNVPELSFWYHAYGTQIAGTQLRIEDTTGTQTLVWSLSGQQQTASTDPWLEVIVNLSAFANRKVRFRWTGSSTQNFGFLIQAAIDDIDVHEAPNCPKPQNLNALSTSATTATLSWTGGTSPWVIKYGPVGFNPATAGTRVVATSNPFTVSGLTQNTSYDFYVKDSCGGANGVSAWSTSTQAATACTSVAAPFSESFQSGVWTVSSASNIAGVISGCWSRSTGSVNSDFFWTVGQGPMQITTTGPNQGIAGGKYMYTHGFGNGGITQATLTSLWINTSSLNVPMLRFSSHLFGNLIDRLVVFADTGTGWNQILTVLPGNQVGAGSPWTLHEIQLPAYAGKTIRFRFRGQKSPTAGYAELAIDEFSVVEAPLPTCSAPSALSASGITPVGAVISYTAGGGSTRIAVGPVGFTPGAASVVASGITNPYALGGLAPSTTYHVYLKDTCAGVGLASPWVGPLAFTTLVCPPASATFTHAVVGSNLILNAQNISPSNNYQWTLVNSSGGIVATRTGGATTIPVGTTGSFTLTLVVTNFCGNTATASITINICAPLGGGFSHSVNGNTVNFTSLAVNSAGQVWNFGDGNQGSGSNPSHTYAASGSYTVVMKSYNICGDTLTTSQTVVTCSRPTAEWTAQILSSNGAGMQVQFNATPWSSPDAVSFQWFFGDGTNGFGANPLKTYSVPGLFYQVSLVATNTCGGKDTLTKSLRSVGMDEASVGAMWYPNPAASGQWISSPSDGEVSVYTLTGQRLAWSQRTESGRIQVQIPEFCPAGVYVLWQDGLAVRLTVQ